MESTKLKIISALFVIVALTTFSSCSGQSKDKEASKQENTRVLKSYELVSAEEFKALLEKEKNPQLIDVRTPDEFEQGAIAGAVNYNYLSAVFRNQVPVINKNRPVFLYCASGGRSRMAADILKHEGGFKTIIDLKGGYPAWQKLKQ